MLLERRQRQQSIVDDYRSAVQDVQAWLEKTFRSLEDLDSGLSLGSQERATKVRNLSEEFELVAAETVAGLKDKADSASIEVGDLDRQQVSEQTTSIERRINELRKRIERKKQLVELAAASFEDTKNEIEEASQWVKEKLDWLQKLKDDDLAEDYDDNVDLLRNAFKEAETRKMTIDSLFNKVSVVKADVSEKEYELLSNCVGKLSDNHLSLMKKLKEFLDEECQGVEKKKKFQEDYDAAVAWIKVKSNEYISW